MMLETTTFGGLLREIFDLPVCFMLADCEIKELMVFFLMSYEDLQLHSKQASYLSIEESILVLQTYRAAFLLKFFITKYPRVKVE